MGKLVIMIGLPGSGKSTFIENYWDKSYKIFSSDKYREIILGDEKDQSNNNKVFDILYKDLETALKFGYNCILDATNCTYKSRAKVIQLGKKYFYTIEARVICQPIEICIKQDSKRNRTVGENVIKKFASNYQFPQYWEGFDGISITYLNYDKYNQESFEDNYEEILKNNIKTIKLKMDSFEQFNPHHNKTVGKHSDAIVTQIDCEYNKGNINKEEKAILTFAAKWHDLGKLYTQTFDDQGVAHYFGHANYSVLKILDYIYYYESNFGELDKKDFIEALFYVNNHMVIREILKSEKAISKWKDKWGERRFNLLVSFSKWDDKACLSI